MKTLDYIVKKYNINLSNAGKDRYLVIPGVRRVDLVKLFSELNYKTGAEIGVMRGEFSEVICQNNPGVKLFAIDPWKSYEGYNDFLKQAQYSDSYYSGLYHEAVKRLSKYDCQIVKKSSMEAVEGFGDESLDFVYIDANHALRYIVEWTKKVRRGGIVSEHDFCEDKKATRKSDVIHALNAYIAAYNIDFVFVLGKRMTKKRDLQRSWFFVKQ